MACQRQRHARRLDVRHQSRIAKQVVKVVPAGTGVDLMKEDYGDNLRILLGVCSLVLLIACANIANLLLARGAARRAPSSSA